MEYRIFCRVDKKLKDGFELAVRLQGTRTQKAVYGLLCEYIEQTKQLQQQGKLKQL